MLDAAKKIVCQERTHQHGDTVESFKVIAEFWQAYLRAVNRGTDPLRVGVVDVAEMMSFVKKVRFIFGDKTDSENFVDDIGYISIAGMFAGVKPVQAMPEPEPIDWRKSQMVAKPNTAPVNLDAMEAKVRGAAE
jgi:hypothetical protein